MPLYSLTLEQIRILYHYNLDHKVDWGRENLLVVTKVRAEIGSFEYHSKMEKLSSSSEDVGLDELGEGSKEVVSKIKEFGGDIGSELLGDRGGDVLFGGRKGGEGGGL
ncbi:hypothetical protein Tco_0747853 [Tanacetum coccineum]|uniref:Uncharacterized protein n=1 Tax=Tanacetum coccineum TaxID=301880 RepID=A0ABQ4YWT8_9ASTR